MLNNVIDPITGLPRKLGELYNDRNIRLVGEMRWDAAANRVDTRNLRVISTPSDGGSPAITVIPDGSYTLSTGNTSIWVQLRRTAGTTTVVPGTSLVADVSTQDKPRQDWIQLFLRTSTGDIVTLGNWVVLAAPQWTKAGVTRGTSIYDAIVGSATNPFSTHTTIQGAIDDALDGDRILVLSGQYSISGPGNTVLDSSAALSWSGKTLTLEGEGYTTVVQNTGSLARAFSIFSTNSSSNASFGSGSRVLNMHLKNYPQTVRLNGGTEFGVRHCGFDFYSTAVSSYVAPDKTGTGTFAANVVKEQTLVGSTFAARQTIVGAEIVTDVQTGSSAVLSSSGSRVISVQNALRVGDTEAPTQALDVVGSIRTTTGLLSTAASSVNVVSDSGALQNLKAKTLVLSTSASDTTAGLLVRGPAEITGDTTLSALNASQVVITDASKKLSTVVYTSAATGGTLVLRDANGDTTVRNLTAQGTLSVSSSVNFAALNAGQAVVTDANKNLSTVGYTSAATGGTLVLRDANGDTTVRNLTAQGTLSVSSTVTFNALTANRVVITDANKRLASLDYTSAATANTLVYRDASGNTSVANLSASSLSVSGTVKFSGLTASRVVTVNASTELNTIEHTTGTTGDSLVVRTGTGGIAAGEGGLFAYANNSNYYARIRHTAVSGVNNGNLHIDTYGSPAVSCFINWFSGSGLVVGNGNNNYGTIDCGTIIARGNITASGNITSSSGAFIGNIQNSGDLTLNWWSGTSGVVKVGNNNGNFGELQASVLKGLLLSTLRDNDTISPYPKGGNNAGCIRGWGNNNHSFGWNGGTPGLTPTSDGAAAPGQFQLDFIVDTTRVLSFVFNSNQVGKYFHL